MNVLGLFPIPVAIIEEREPTDSELSYIKNVEKRDNNENLASKDTYMLDRDELSGLRNIIEFHVNDFFFKALAVDTPCKLRITQRWCNYSESDESHHTHMHPNSALSGVYYPQAKHPDDSLSFHNPKEIANILSPKTYESNLWNSHTWWLPIKTGNIIIFPSYLYHSVRPIKNRNSTRISLSFNTFYDGILGDESSLSALKVKTCM
jgi:uncharacterized protein (TIGR02466 family)